MVAEKWKFDSRSVHFILTLRATYFDNSASSVFARGQEDRQFLVRGQTLSKQLRAEALPGMRKSPQAAPKRPNRVCCETTGGPATE